MSLDPFYLDEFETDPFKFDVASVFARCQRGRRARESAARLERVRGIEPPAPLQRRLA